MVIIRKTHPAEKSCHSSRVFVQRSILSVIISGDEIEIESVKHSIKKYINQISEQRSEKAMTDLWLDMKRWETIPYWLQDKITPTSEMCLVTQFPNLGIRN